LFNKYKSASGDIESEGIQSFCDDLGINPLDSVILVISFHFKAETMGIFKKNEFTSGLKSLGCDSIQKIREKIPQLRQQLNEFRTFKQIYNFVFTFSREVGCRNLNFEVAIELWRLLLAEKFQMVHRWIEFLQGREKKHDISKDTWEMLLDFLDNVQKNGIEAHDPNSSWPILIDEFVESLNS
jgi:DCN1-like protein 1/2